MARFKREAQSAAALNHPNIVQVYAISEFDGQHCFAMEFVRGSSVQQIIRADGPMDPVKAARLILQAASGLGAAHGKGIYHRDIKPANLMVDESGILKIADFGLAILAAGTTQLTATGMFMGTPGYLSPEQCLGDKIDQRTDIYSLGVTLYEMLTGVTPLKADSPLALLRQIIDVEPRDVGELRPEVPESLRAILRKMMAKKPDDRYLDCAALITDLQQWLESVGAQTSASSSHYSLPASSGSLRDAATVIAPTLQSKQNTVKAPVTKPAASSSRQNSMAALVIALVLMVAAGASYATWKYVLDEPELSFAAIMDSMSADKPAREQSGPEGYSNTPVNEDASPQVDETPQFANSSYPESGALSQTGQLDLQSSQNEWLDDEPDATADMAGQNPTATDTRVDVDGLGQTENEVSSGSEVSNPVAANTPVGALESSSVTAATWVDVDEQKPGETLAMADTGTSNTLLADSQGSNTSASKVSPGGKQEVAYSGNSTTTIPAVSTVSAASKPAVAAPVIGTGVALVSVGEVLLADSDSAMAAVKFGP